MEDWSFLYYILSLLNYFNTAAPNGYPGSCGPCVIRLIECHRLYGPLLPTGQSLAVGLESPINCDFFDPYSSVVVTGY